MFINFYRKLLNRWRCSHTFSRILSISLSRFLLNENAQNIMHNIYVIRNNNDAIWVYIAVKKALILSLSPNSSDSPISDSIAWNPTKLCIQYTYFKRWHWYKFWEHCNYNLSNFFFLFNEIAQKFMCKIWLLEITIIYFRCV